MHAKVVRSVLTVGCAIAVLLPVAVSTAATVPGKKPATEMKAKGLGSVIATPKRLAIYYSNAEKQAKGKIRCKGGCLKARPPVYVSGRISKHIKGVMATFGTIKRGAKRQLTVNGLPAYTYKKDRAGTVRGNKIGGWFAVRVMGAAATPLAIETTSNVGRVIATRAKLGLYYWDVEKKAGGEIRCTGNCATVWPPVFVTADVPKRIPGVMATFGTVKRGSKLQLTVNGLPAYTYHHDKANVVLCDDVGGWFAFRPQ